jgi:hypothetical protein
MILFEHTKVFIADLAPRFPLDAPDIRIAAAAEGDDGTVKRDGGGAT